MELHKGRPDDAAGRQGRELRCYDLLDRLGIEYYRTDHAPATNMEACLDIDAALGVLICKNLFLCNRQKTDYYLLMMPGDAPFKTKELSAQLGVSRLSFGSEEAMLELLDVQPGSVSVLGLMNDSEKRVRLLVERRVLEGEYLGCHPCMNTSSLKLRTADVIGRFLPAVGHDYTVVSLNEGNETE